MPRPSASCISALEFRQWVASWELGIVPPWITAFDNLWMDVNIHIGIVTRRGLKSHPKKIPHWDHFRSYLPIPQTSSNNMTFWQYSKRREIQHGHIMRYHAISIHIHVPRHIIKVPLLRFLALSYWNLSPKGTKRSMSKQRVSHNESIVAGTHPHNLEAQQPWPLPMLLRWEPCHPLPGFPKSQQSWISIGCTDFSTRWLP